MTAIIFRINNVRLHDPYLHFNSGFGGGLHLGHWIIFSFVESRIQSR